MKNTIIFTVCLLLSVLLISIFPTDADAAIYEDTVRLHILAESDSAEDQEIKLYLRDKLLEKYSAELALSDDAEAATEALDERIGDIEDDCNLWLAERGYDKSAAVTLLHEWYNTREYGELTLPSGEYVSLRIVIGEGNGQNWWCVMYPPLCLDAAVSETDRGYTGTEERLITRGGYRIKFKLLEVTSSIFETFSE